jgi:hypothetical protein
MNLFWAIQESLRTIRRSAPTDSFFSPWSLNLLDKFKKAYSEGQSDRLNRLIDEALEIEDQIAAGKYPYTGDAPFIIGKSTSAKLFVLDTSILHSTVQPRALLKNDGTIDATHIVESVRLPDPTVKNMDEMLVAAGS